MALDLIKQYLVGIGFNVDANSLKTAQESMSQADESIKKFNSDSNKGFSETSGSLKDLFNLFASSPTLIKTMTLNGPFRSLIKDISLAKKMYKEMTEIKPENSENKSKPNQSKKFNIIDNLDKLNLEDSKEEIAEFAKNSSKNLGNVEEVAKGLLSKGGGSISAFAGVSVAALAGIAIAAVATIAAIKKLITSLNDLAEEDIGYEKLSRQLWTTKENAKEISTALDTLGASMQDLWLSPTLLKQFTQLRKDAQSMKMPADFNQNIKVVQGLGLELKRFKQMAGMFFKLVGSYILKYLAGPLDEIRGKAHNLNDWLAANLPKIAKVIGTIIGILLRIIIITGKIGAVIWKLTTPLRFIFKLIGMLFGAFDKAPEPVKKAVKIIGGALMLITNPILLIIGLIDDIMTYFRGGKSVIGSYIDKVVGKSENAGKVIKSILTVIKRILTGGLSLNPWDNYWKKAKETFEKIKNKAKETWDKVKEWSKDKKDKIQDFVNDAREKVQGYQNSTVNNTAANYVTSNSSKISNRTTTANSNNTISNANTINVYGSGDSKSTAGAVKNVLTGISTRNVQGVLN